MSPGCAGKNSLRNGGSFERVHNALRLPTCVLPDMQGLSAEAIDDTLSEEEHEEGTEPQN